MVTKKKLIYIQWEYQNIIIYFRNIMTAYSLNSIREDQPRFKLYHMNDNYFIDISHNPIS